MTLSASPRMGSLAATRMRRGVMAAGVALVAGAVVSTVLVLDGSGSPRAVVVPPGVRKVEIRSGFPHARPAVSYSITDPVTVRRITRLLNALPRRRTTYGGRYGLGVAGVRHNVMCPAIGGPTASLELQGADGTVLASASFVTGAGLSAACNPLWFGRGQSAAAGTGFFHPQLALTGTSWPQTHFAAQLERLIGRPLCQRAPGASAQHCKP